MKLDVTDLPNSISQAMLVVPFTNIPQHSLLGTVLVQQLHRKPLKILLSLLSSFVEWNLWKVDRFLDKRTSRSSHMDGL